MLKKIVLSFLAFLVIFTSLAPNFFLAKAQDEPQAQTEGSWYNQGFTEWYTKVFDTENPSEIFGERYTAAQVQWVVWGLLSMPLNLLGKDNQEVINCFLKGVGGDRQNLIECAQGAVGAITNVLKLLTPNIVSGPPTSFVAMVFDTDGRAISGIKYSKGLISKFSLVQEAKAQGFGYGALEALQKYWSGFLKMAYAIVILITIVFAFMIMFRVKINPQIVISVQSALPKMIGAVILATFSYAIAGFMIDLLYVVGGLFASLVNLAGFTDTQTAFQSIIPIQGNEGLGNFYILGWMFAYAITFLLATVVSFAVTLVNLSIWGALASFVMFVMTVWVVILMIVYAVKVPWVLLKTLVSIYLSIVIAPIQIVAGALIPSIGFGQWLKKLVAELMVFPVTGLFMLFASLAISNSFAVNWQILTGTFADWLPEVFGPPPGRLWSPPIIGSADDMGGLLWVVVSFMFVIMIPKVVDLLKSLIMGEKFSFGTAIGEALGPIDWARKSAPVRAIGDITQGIAATRFAQSNAAIWIADRLGFQKELEYVKNKAATQVTDTR